MPYLFKMRREAPFLNVRSMHAPNSKEGRFDLNSKAGHWTKEYARTRAWHLSDSKNDNRLNTRMWEVTPIPFSQASAITKLLKGNLFGIVLQGTRRKGLLSNSGVRFAAKSTEKLYSVSKSRCLESGAFPLPRYIIWYSSVDSHTHGCAHTYAYILHKPEGQLRNNVMA